MSFKRCSWCKSETSIRYHDEEWCQITSIDNTYLFELLILECMQAGLSWEIILQKRENYRACLDNFDYLKISKYDEDKKQALLQNPGIIRNKLKINAIINNAKCYINVLSEFHSFYDYLMQFTLNQVFHENILTTTNELANKISHDLKKRGFKFVGDKIIYSYLQAIGIVISHEEGCFMERKL